MIGLHKALGLFVNQRSNDVTVIGCRAAVADAVIVVVNVVVVHRAAPRPDAQLLRQSSLGNDGLGSRGEHQRRVDLVELRTVIVDVLCFFVPLCDLWIFNKDGQKV